MAIKKIKDKVGKKEHKLPKLKLPRKMPSPGTKGGGGDSGKKGPGAGKAILPLALAGIIAVFASRCGGLGFGGFGNGFGILPGGGSEVSSEAGTGEESTGSGSATSSEAMQKSEQMEVDDEIHYVDLTINEDGYIYQNTKQELPDIMDDLKEGDVIRLKTHRASKKDVDQLRDVAKEKGVEIINEK